jgi:hypothetical protein
MITVAPAAELAVVGIKQSSVVTLASHGLLDVDQVAAAFRFRNSFEVTIEAKRQSIGFNEWQAPGPIPAGVAESRLIAKQDLRAARALLGSHGYMLVGKVCGEGWHIGDLYRTRRERDTMTDMLRIHLTSLAKLWR